MSTRAAPDVEAAFRQQGQTRKLDEIEASLRQRAFSMTDHPIVQNAAADVPRAINMLLKNAREFSRANADSFEALAKIAEKHPDYAVSIVQGIADIGDSQAALALKGFPMARSAADAEAYIDAVAAAKDKFPGRTVELVLSSIAHKNPAAGSKAISALVDLDTDFGVIEAISLTYKNAERTAYLLPLLAKKPGHELPVVSLHDQDTANHLPFSAYVDALSNFKTDIAVDCLAGLAVAAIWPGEGETAVRGIQRIGGDHAAKTLSMIAVSEKDLRLPCLTALFALRDAAVEGGRNDLTAIDSGLRRTLNTAMNVDEVKGIVKKGEVSAFNTAFRKADELKLASGSETYSGLFAETLNVVHQRRRLDERLSAFARQP